MFGNINYIIARNGATKQGRGRRLPFYSILVRRGSHVRGGKSGPKFFQVRKFIGGLEETLVTDAWHLNLMNLPTGSRHNG